MINSRRLFWKLWIKTTANTTPATRFVNLLHALGKGSPVKRYNIKYSPDALHDIELIFSYIATEYNDLESATKITTRIFEKCENLVLFPEAHPAKTKLKGQDIHFTHFKKYVVVYSVDKANSIVSVYRIVYGRRNVDTMLREYFSKI